MSTFLTDAAISDDVARDVVVRVESAADVFVHARHGGVEELAKRVAGRAAEAVPGHLFLWTSPTGEQWAQYRPDTPPKGKGEKGTRAWPKYLSSSASPGMMVPPSHAAHLREAGTMLLVEGSKQTLAAASATNIGLTSRGSQRPYAVVGMAGCWNWSRGGSASDDLKAAITRGRLERALDVMYVALDADFETNERVWDAAEGLRAQVQRLAPRTRVYWVQVPTAAGAKTGLDDYLATVPLADREEVLEQLMDTALTELPPRPLPPYKPSTRGLVMDPDRGRAVTIVRERYDEEAKEVVPVSPPEVTQVLDFALVVTGVRAISQRGTRTTEIAVRLTTTVAGELIAVDTVIPYETVGKPGAIYKILAAFPSGYSVRKTPPPMWHQDVIEAMLRTAPDVGVEVIDHMGWLELATGELAYATPGRVMTARGPVDEVRVDLGEDAEDVAIFDFTLLPRVKRMGALRRDFSFAEEAASHPAVPIALWGAMGLALSGQKPSGASVVLVGGGGKGKSWWLRWAAGHLRESMRMTAVMAGTARALESADEGWQDTIAVLDDVRPDTAKRGEMSPDFEAALRLIRVAYDGPDARRSRLQARETGGFQQAHKATSVPVPVISAESLPLTAATHTTLMRTLTIPVGDAGLIAWDRGVDADERLREWVQDETGSWAYAALVSHVMQAASSYGRGLSGLAEWRERVFVPRRGELQTQLAALGVSETRVAQVTAGLLAGYELVLEAAHAVGALDDVTYERKRREGFDVLARAMREHDERFVQQSRPSGPNVVARLREAVASGRVRLTSAASPDADGRDSRLVIGDMTGAEVRLLPDACAGVLGMDRSSFVGQMRDVAVPGADGKTTRSVRVGGVRVRAVVVTRAAWDADSSVPSAVPNAA